MEEEKRICKVRTPAIEPSQRPGKRVFAELPCPGSLTGPCTQGKCRWSCEKCNKYIEFGFDGHFYCDCGKSSIETFTFNCGSAKHGYSYIQLPTTNVCELIKEFAAPKAVNILLLGESGVGKSTYINGIVNYLYFNTLEEAMAAGPLYLIPVSFSVMDEDGEEIDVTFDTSPNEQHSTPEAAATQSPVSYFFTCGDKAFRIIDTPGIGDTRGEKQDQINFDKIISHISRYTDLHAVCILLMPNVSRLSESFRYCITELLTHLHRDVANNIVFCFTNTRATGYQPLNTLKPLRALLKEFEDKESVKIPLTKDNWFCVDNEAFKFCCALAQRSDVKFSEIDSRSFPESWKTSAIQTHKLFDYISKLEPHKSEATVSLNHVKSIISNLRQPIFETLKTVSKNITLAKNQTLKIEELKSRGEDLQKVLNIIKIRLVAKDIQCPRMVCTFCSVTVVDTKDEQLTKPQTIYKQICHDMCGAKREEKLLHFLQRKEFASNDLLHLCQVMKKGVCTACKCVASKHMRITYELVEEPFVLEDANVRAKIDACANDADKAQIKQNQLEDEIKELEDENGHILEMTAQFESFMKTHAIVQQRDAFEDFIISHIEHQEHSTDRTLHDYLVASKVTYLNKVKLLDEQKDGREITTAEVNELIKKLLSLPKTGADLKQILHVAKEAERKTVTSDDKYSTPKAMWTRIKGGAYSVFGAAGRS